MPPSSFNIIINQASWSHFRYLLGEYQKYQGGRPIATPELGQGAYVRESLTPFIQQPSTLAIDPVTGRTPYPTDYEMWDAMYYGIYKQRVTWAQQDKLSFYLNDPNTPVADNPIFLSIYRGFQVYPISVGTTELSYIRTPQTINWAYTTDIYGRPNYNAASSIDPQWRRPDMLEVITRALAMIGINLQSQAIEQYANQIKAGGQ